jgi:hydroxymethylbilane synthase
MQSNQKLIIGTRGSQLALWQANEVKRLLEEAHADQNLSIELRIFHTRGDHILDRPLAEVGGKGLFTKELEDSLILGEIHLAVHSLKDMPTELPKGLILGAIPNRADVRDVLIFRRGEAVDDLKVIGTSSLRRAALAQRKWPQAQIVSIRGNVPTRMNRVFDEGDRRVDAVLLALAGIVRLKLNQDEKFDYLPLNPDKWIPAASQGALAIECREDDHWVRHLLSPLHQEKVSQCILAERAFLRAVEGDCRVPVGASATVDLGNMRIKGFVSSPDGKEYLEQTMYIEDFQNPEQIGIDLAKSLLSMGGKEILEALRSQV